MSPTGRLPAVEAGPALVGLGPVKCPYVPAEEVAATAAVLSHLRDSVWDLNAGTKGPARGEAAAFQSLLDSALLPALIYSAWCESEAYSAHLQPAMAAHLPFPLSYIIPANHRRIVYAAASRALDAFAAKLEGTGAFLLGPNPSTVDAQLYGCLAYLKTAPVVHPALHRHFLSLRELGAYVARVADALNGQDAPPSRQPAGASGASWSEWAGPSGQESRANKEASALSASLNRKGKIWVGCAAAIIITYVVLGGQYVQFGFMDDEDELDED